MALCGGDGRASRGRGIPLPQSAAGHAHHGVNLRRLPFGATTGYLQHLIDGLVAAPLIAASVRRVHIGARRWGAAERHWQQFVNLERERMSSGERVVDGSGSSERSTNPTRPTLRAQPIAHSIALRSVCPTLIAAHASDLSRLVTQSATLIAHASGWPNSCITTASAA